MNTELKNKWIAALRSGDYVQTSRNGWGDGREARDPELRSYCCLNVLCDVVHGASIHNLIDTESRDIFAIIENNRADKDKNSVSTLITMNDSGEHDFNSIADWIQENINEH